ncbi:uncharacterized protein LOC135193461 [Vanessa tameamea]|uniref:Uncharacterized protein LOC135193461 n=1 Tax=Vanessa tameamea TaxID=334116 RepID=A0ABM4ALA1_VANTA
MSQEDSVDTTHSFSQGTMSRYLRPDRFDIEPNSSNSDLKWTHWRFTFTNFLSEEISTNTPDSMKLMLLVNHLAPTIFSYIRDCKFYEDAIKLLDSIYIKPRNEVLARHILITRKQRPEETICEYSRALKLLAHDCIFRNVTAEEHEQQTIRGAFIAGISSQKIRERLLENITITMDEALNKAISLETAEKNSEIIAGNTNSSQLNAFSNNINDFNQNVSVSTTQRRRCFFCGGNIHQRIKCPAFKVTCQLCSKQGHFAKVCRSGNQQTVNVLTTDTSLHYSHESFLAASPSSLQNATVPIFINNIRADALIDTGSSVSFINKKLVQIMNLKIKPCKQIITLASLTHVSFVEGMCHATVKLQHHIYQQRQLLIVNNLCADIIIGHDILKDHSKLEFKFGGNREPLKICNVMNASVPPVSLFTNLSSDIKPVAVKSRRYSKEDSDFINTEISKLLADGVIEPSVSPWRAQVLVAGGGIHRKRLVVDYSQTINRFTLLDAYPLPNIENVVSEVAKYNYFSQIDLKSAYHQIPILEKEKLFTAFEASGNLYQFTRIPFGVTNGVAAFQRALHFIIKTEHLKGTFCYLDDVTVCGMDKGDHDHNLNCFMAAVKKYNLTLNEQKSTFGVNSINLLGYNIKDNTVKPDSNRLKPLLDLPPPTNNSELKRTLGLFAHYAKWINNFSKKIKPLIGIKSFPIDDTAKTCFVSLKSEIEKSTLAVIDDNDILTVETDASEFAIAASLSQKGRPIAFFSRTLSDSEQRQSSIEKEACAIVESLRKWRHYLIENEKLERWRLELSCFKYDIIYRPGKENTVADALSRVCAHMNVDKLRELHNSLCHPGIVRMMHWVRMKNLPYSVNDIKSLIQSCQICAEIKPRFMKSKGQLIKATAPFERLNIDFKGPLPSNTPNKYLLTIIDEFSRFPFAYACKEITTATVIRCLKDLFYTFGTPLYIHSDRGSAFISKEFTEFLSSLGIACSRTTPYNPRGNGQVERLNGTLWKTLQLALRTREMPIESWEQFLPMSLHTIRSLLCIPINTTPHERLFNHPRRSPHGESLPSWLIPGPVLMKKNIRNKNDPYVEEVELLQSNPYYSFVKHKNGRESTVSNRNLAPLPTPIEQYIDQNLEEQLNNSTTKRQQEQEEIVDVFYDSEDRNINAEHIDVQEMQSVTPSTSEDQHLRRSERTRRTPYYLKDYSCVLENVRGGE